MPTASEAAARRIILAGANPGVRLFDAEGRVTAFASVWMVDWSIHGAGTAVVLWHQGRVRLISTELHLASWLEQYFVRWFPEVEGLDWPAAVPERQPVQVSMDLSDGLGGGLSVRAADVGLELSGVLDRRQFATDNFPLDGVPHSLSLVIAPVRSAVLTIGGEPVAGTVQLDGPPERPSSSAFLTTAEVWRG